jgi:hypothetical protein
MTRSVLGVMALLLAAGVRAQEAPQPPLCFHAGFDGTVDAVAAGQGKPLTVTGPVEFRPGKVGQALLCGDGGAALQYATSGNLPTDSGTVEMWVCPLDWTGAEDTFHVFLEARDPGWLVFYRYYQGGILTLVGATPQSYVSAASVPIRWVPGEWHHLAGTWRGSRLEVYVDGQPAGFCSEPRLPERFGDTFEVGDRPWHVARRQQTLVDEVRIYSMPLGPSDIASLARGESPALAPSLQVALSSVATGDALDVGCDAAGLVGGLGPGREAVVTLEGAGGAAPLVTARTAEFARQVGHVTLPLAEVPPGDYQVRARILDAAGQTVAEKTQPFGRPGPPVWRGNTLGSAHKVLAPWAPLRTDAATGALDCWGREYRYDGLLASATTQGRALLASPVTLEAVVGGRMVPLRGTSKVTGSSDTRAALEGTVAGSGLSARVQHQVEYDGFTWTDVTLEAGAPTTVDELRLTWTMPAARATLLHADRLSWIANAAGSLPQEGWSSPFAPFFWLGDESGGLSWFAESTEGWVAGSANPAIQVSREGDVVRATVRLVAAPTRLDGVRHYGFGMMATPVRPKPEKARGLRMLPAPRSTFEIVWPNESMKYYGYTEPIDAAAFGKRVDDAHAARRRVVPYINLNFMSAGVPEWLVYGHAFASDPPRPVTPSDVAAMGHASMGTCPASRDWQDFILYRINEMIDRYGVDGIYIDCWGPTGCNTPPCGWVNAAGQRNETNPIRAYREILRRVATLFQERRPDPLLQIHMSSEVNIPMLAFADTLLDGEQFVSGNLKDDYLPLLPPDKFRAEFMGHNWGPVDFFLPEFRDGNEPRGTPNLAAYLLLHDVQPWPIWSDGATWTRLYDALDAFGYTEARFLPYWEPTGVTCDPQVLVSCYLREGKVLLAVMNTGEATEARLDLDLGRLGLAGVSAATDALRGDTMRLGFRGITVPLDEHQGRVVEVRE